MIIIAFFDKDAILFWKTSKWVIYDEKLHIIRKYEHKVK